MIGVDKLQAEPVNALLQNPFSGNEKKSHSIKNDVGSLQSNDLSRGILSVDKTQKILQQELIGKLEERFKIEGIELKGLKANDFTPEKVAGRILNFIDLGVSRAGDSEEKKNVLAKARKGVEQGFKDAREILDAIGVLNGKVKEDINKTYDLIQAGFDKFGKPNVDDKDKKDNQVALIDEAGLSASASEESRKTSVDITTRDGDIVTIDLSRNTKESTAQFYAQDGNNSVYASSSSSSSYTNIQYTVNGSLDEGEKKAIDDLLDQLNGVAKDFYQGDIESAFQKAKKVGFNSDELAQFSVDLSQSKTNVSAVSSYQNVQNQNLQNQSLQNKNLQNNSNGIDDESKEAKLDDESKESNFVKEVTAFLNQANDVLKNNAFELFANADKVAKDILNASLKLQDNEQQDDEQQDDKKEPASNSINELVDSLYKVNKDSTI